MKHHLIGAIAAFGMLTGCASTGEADPSPAQPSQPAQQNYEIDVKKARDVGMPSEENWAAWINLMPGSEPMLYVTGRVQTPTPGYTVTLSPTTPQGINPAILMLDMYLEPPGTDVIVPQVLTWTDVRYEAAATKGQYAEVNIMAADGTMRRIAVTEAH